MHRPPRAGVLLLALLVVLAAALRISQIPESLWLDELHTAWTVADEAAAVIPRAQAGNQPPAYFLLLWAECRLFGISEVTLRLPSVIAGLTLLLVLFAVVQRWTQSSSAALLTVLLAAVDRNCLFYSQEARPYACVQLAGLVQLWLYWQLLWCPTRWRRVAWVGASWLLFYLHYTAALLIAAELLAYGVLLSRWAWRPAYRPQQIAVDLGLWLLGCLPATPHLEEIAARRRNWELFIPRQPLWAVCTMLPLDSYLILPAAIWAAAWTWRVARRSTASATQPNAELDHSQSTGTAPIPAFDSRLLILVLAWLFVPLGLAWTCTYLDIARLFFLRYVMGAALAPLVFTGLCYAACPGRLSRWVLATGVTLATVWQGGMLEQFSTDGRFVGDRNQDWRGAVAALNDGQRQASLPVFVRSGLIEADGLRQQPEPQAWLREYCLLPVTGIYRVAGASATLTPLPTSRPGRLAEVDRQRIEAAGGAWFLLLGSREGVRQISRDVCHSWPVSQPASDGRTVPSPSGESDRKIVPSPRYSGERGGERGQAANAGILVARFPSIEETWYGEVAVLRLTLHGERSETGR